MKHSTIVAPLLLALMAASCAHGPRLVTGTPVTDTVEAQPFKTSFVAGACSGAPDQACLDKYNQMVRARLTQTYPWADWNAVDIQCRANPVECRDHHNYEAWGRDSHNARASDAAAVQQQAAIQQFSTSLHNSAEQMKQRQPTSCRSRPNLLGGYDTSCDNE